LVYTTEQTVCQLLLTR